MKLVAIPNERYESYRLNVMFDCYKWDPQFLDHNTIAKYALVISQEEHRLLSRLTERLDTETQAAEQFLNQNLELIKPLAIPRKFKKELVRMKNYDAGKHVRLMRYDFHPTIDAGWSGVAICGRSLHSKTFRMIDGTHAIFHFLCYTQNNPPWLY